MTYQQSPLKHIYFQDTTFLRLFSYHSGHSSVSFAGSFSLPSSLCITVPQSSGLRPLSLLAYTLGSLMQPHSFKGICTLMTPKSIYPTPTLP